MDDLNKEDLIKKIQELESHVHELEKDLIHDSLTGLKTRGFFEEESKTYLNMINSDHDNKRKQWFGFKNLAVLFLDIDHFKSVNDKYGHDVGDLVLKNVSETIKKSVRVGDTVSRWGGEEIVVTLLGANTEDASIKAEDIRKRVEEIVFKEVPDLKVTISIGIASSDMSGNFEELVKKADQALYKSKENGRNKVTIFQG